MPWIWLLNLGLAVATLLFGMRTYEIWSRPVTLPPVVGIEAPQGTPSPPPVAPRPKAPSRKGYEVIVAQDLFNAEREEPKSPQAAKTKKPVATPAQKKETDEAFKRLTLYGIVLAKELRLALIEEASARRRPTGFRTRKPSAKAQAETFWVEQGDHLGDFTVREIRKESVLLEAGGSTYELLLYDKDNPKKRGVVPKAQAPVVVGVPVEASQAPPKRAQGPQEAVGASRPATAPSQAPTRSVQRPAPRATHPRAVRRKP